MQMLPIHVLLWKFVISLKDVSLMLILTNSKLLLCFHMLFYHTILLIWLLQQFQCLFPHHHLWWNTNWDMIWRLRIPLIVERDLLNHLDIQTRNIPILLKIHQARHLNIGWNLHHSIHPVLSNSTPILI